MGCCRSHRSMVGVLLGFVVLSAVCAAHRPPYLGFYMDSNATSHTAGANLYLASTPALAVRARASGGMVSLLKVDGAFLQRNPLDPTNRKNMTLRPDWRAQWASLVPVAQELLASGMVCPVPHNITPCTGHNSELPAFFAPIRASTKTAR